MAYPISKLWLYPFCRLMIREIKGIENIPNKSKFIIVANHEHLVDPLHILYPILRKLNKKVHFVATPTWWFLGETICRKWAGTIPLFNSEQVYKESRGLLESHEIVGIFPEGGTRRTKNPKTGAVRLALETKTPILPIGIRTSYTPFDSTVNIGKIVYLKQGKNIKKQVKDLLKEIYRLSDAKL